MYAIGARNEAWAPAESDAQQTDIPEEWPHAHVLLTNTLGRQRLARLRKIPASNGYGVHDDH